MSDNFIRDLRPEGEAEPSLKDFKGVKTTTSTLQLAHTSEALHGEAAKQPGRLGGRGEAARQGRSNQPEGAPESHANSEWSQW